MALNSFSNKLTPISYIYSNAFKIRFLKFIAFFIHRVDDNLHVSKNERHEYPRKISTVWKQVNRIKIDTALQKDGITYFFSGKLFYKFNDAKMELEIKKPRISSEHFMACRYTEEELTNIQRSAYTQSEEDIETSSAPTISTSTTFSVFTILLVFSRISILKQLF